MDRGSVRTGHSQSGFCVKINCVEVFASFWKCLTMGNRGFPILGNTAKCRKAPYNTRIDYEAEPHSLGLSSSSVASPLMLSTILRSSSLVLTKREFNSARELTPSNLIVVSISSLNTVMLQLAGVSKWRGGGAHIRLPARHQTVCRHPQLLPLGRWL